MHGIQYSTEELESLGGAPKAAATGAFAALQDEPEVIEDLGEATEIPQQVRDTVAGIPTREETLSYHDYLKAEGAPVFVLNYVAIQAEQKEPLA